MPNWLATTYGQEPFFAQAGSVFTIHRLAHQGISGYRVLEVAGLESYGFIYHSGMADLSELVNLLGRGIYYADAITTVSERYAQEIQTAEFGEGLHPLLREKADRLFGVLNGIDTAAYDPATDTQIAQTFDADTLNRRSANKSVLQGQFGLRQDAAVPLMGMVTRLNQAKGLDLLGSILRDVLTHTNAQFAILGVGEPEYQSLIEGCARAFPGRVALDLTFSESRERQIHAGSDLFLMPSRTEPCGLGQMLAMRYGSVPIVRATGGLADTVQDYEAVGNTGTGFVFEPCDRMALYAAMIRALEVSKHRDRWSAMQRRCMAQDFSWTRSVRRYVDIYRWVLGEGRRQRGMRDATAGGRDPL